MKHPIDPTKISDDDLALVFYGEHDDPGLATIIANDPQLRQRFDLLSDQLGQLEHLSTPPLAADYGAQVWSRIQARLNDSGAAAKSAPPLWAAWLRPRFSLAGVAMLLAAVGAAFWAGQFSGRSSQQQLAEMAAIDSQRLLNSRVAQHLAATDLLLTQLTNEGAGSGAVGGEVDWATELLWSNRLYRQAAVNAGHPRVAQLLDELEPLLIELAHTDAGAVDRDLLLRVRVMQQNLAQPNNQI